MNTATSVPGKFLEKTALNKALLLCGIVSSLLYIMMLVFIPIQWKEYSSNSQTVSELSAIGAPTRALWVPLGSVYTLLAAIFGFGVLKSAKENTPLKMTGIFIIIYALLGLFWPPMHQREVLAAGGATLTDTLHIVWTIATVVLTVLAIGFGAMAFGKPFRLYSTMTILILFSFGVLTGMDAPKVQSNIATPLVGIWERINISAFMLWFMVLAVILLRMERKR